LRDGSVVEERQAYLRGGAHAPLGRAALEAKFGANALFGGLSEGAAAAALGATSRLLENAGRLDLSALRG
jgi:hypothetical protein